jgi:hypothetical protein
MSMQTHAADARDELVETISDLMAQATKPAATPHATVPRTSARVERRGMASAMAETHLISGGRTISG